jgi:pimeloyl-[acyl-carrier protein] methyl ester esterase
MLHTEIMGRGPDLVLVHGWGMNSAVWHGLAEALAADYRVTLLDLPGHGDSPFDPAASGLEDWARLLLEAAPAAAAWVGWSLGGSLALAAALLSPRRVNALALVTATPRFVRDEHWRHAMPRETLEQFHADLTRDPRATLDRFLALEVSGGEEARTVLRRLRTRLAEKPAPDPAALDNGLDLLRDTDLRGRLGELDVPSLWLYGQRDALVPRRCGDAVQQLLPEARITVLQGAAHAPFLSHPDPAIAHLRKFLETTT